MDIAVEGVMAAMRLRECPIDRGTVTLVMRLGEWPIDRGMQLGE